MAEIRIFATSHRVSLEEGDQLNKNILICSTGYATSLNCILSSGKPFGSIRNSMDGIYPWAISLTPTTFCSLPWRFSFLFFFFFSWWHIVLPTSDIVIVPTDSFSITNIRQGETDFKTLIFHQYFTWNLQIRCHISLDLCRGALTFFSTLTASSSGASFFAG